MTPAGFPHSEILGSTVVCTYPRLIAACHVLHRLLAPRHPPCALSILIYVLFVFSILRYAALKVQARPRRARASGAEPWKPDTVTRLIRRRETRSTLVLESQELSSTGALRDPVGPAP